MSKEALVEDIREDIRVAQRSLAREAYEEWKADEWLRGQEGHGEEKRDEEVGTNVRKGEAGQKDGVGISMMGA